jgi:hypothetical protein
VSDDTLPALLHHYTDRAGLVGIVESRTLWATDIRFLNDETEALYARELFGSLVKRLRSELGTNWAGNVVCDAVEALATSGDFPDTFVVSMCGDGDNLGQWRGYGAQGGGYAIGLGRDRLRAIAGAQDHSLIRLIYDVGEQEAQLEQALRESIPILADWGANPASAPPAAQQLILLGIGFTIAMLSIKNPYFRDEREWRLARLVVPGIFEDRAKVRIHHGVETRYEEIALDEDVFGDSPIVEIVIGPTARSDEAVAGVRDLLDRNHLEDVTVRTSVGPLRH